MKAWLGTALLLLFLAPATAQAQEPSLAGRWEAVYLDQQLGKVTGIVRVDEDQRAVMVEYRHPGNGVRYRLQGTLERKGTGVEVRLRGEQPPPGDWQLPPVGLPVPTAGTLTLDLGDSSLSLPIAAPAPADGTLQLTFAIGDGGGLLTGVWQQAVDPVTGRDDRGGGRAGDFALLEDGSGGAVMAGLETWHRPRAQPILAFALEPQFATTGGDPDFPEPFDAAGRRVRPLADRRLVALFGEELPQAYGDGAVLSSLDPGIDYGLYRLAWDFERPGADRWVLDRALALLEAQVDAATLARLRHSDVVILEARLQPGVLPGSKTFTLNGAEAAWLLQYGDWSARLSLSRDLGFDQSEAADYLVPGETFYLEVWLDRDVPLAEIPGLLAVTDAAGEGLRYVTLGGRRSIPLTPDAEQPRRFRSPPLQLVDPAYLDALPAGTLAVGALPGEKLLATLAGEPLLRLRPQLAAATVLQSPRHLSALLTGDPKARGMTWTDAVGSAAACAGVSGEDLAKLTDEEADSFSDTIIGSVSTGVRDGDPSWPITLVTQVKVGEHAGAIFLRAAFLDLQADRRRALLQPLDDTGLDGFRALLEGEIYDTYAALAAVEVRAPDGGRIPFGHTFSASLLQERYGLEGAALRAFQRAATAEARQGYARAIDAAAAAVAGIDPCEIRALLEHVGVGFEPVARVAKQLLLTLGEAPVGDGGATRPLWAADRRARAWIDRVPLIAQSLLEQKALQRLDNSILFASAMLATLPLALMQSPGALAFMLLNDAAGALYAGYELVDNLASLAAERRFALGASALLGSGRFRQVEARKYEWVAHYFGLVGAGFGAAAGFVEGSALYIGLATRSMQWSAARLSAAWRFAQEVAGAAPAWSAQRLEQVLARLRERLRLAPDADGFRSAVAAEPVEERLAAAEALAEAEALTRSLGEAALETQELAALRLSQELEQALAAPAKPVWAEFLSDQQWRALGWRARAGHVIAFFARHPQEMAALLEVPGALDALALPWDSFEAFARRVQRLRNRAPIRGEDFYYQFEPREFGPAPLVFEGGFHPAMEGPPFGTVDFRVFSGGQGPNIGRFTRGLAPDDRFDTGGHMLTFFVAKIIRSDASPNWLTSPLIHLTEEGVPLGMALNLRAMNALGIRFADLQLTTVKFSNILGVETCAQLWRLRQLYKGVSWSQLFRSTDHFDYARTVLEQAGLKIDDVVIEQAQTLITTRPEWLAKQGWFDGDNLSAYLRRFELTPQSDIDAGYDVYLRVSPR